MHHAAASLLLKCGPCLMGFCAAVISAMPDGWLLAAGSPSILYKKEDAAQQLAAFVRPISHCRCHDRC